MIEDLDRYKFVTSQIVYFADRMKDIFKLHIQVITGIAGGFLYFKTLPNSDKVSDILAAVPYLVVLISSFTIIQLWFDLWAQYGYRKAEAELLKDPKRAPKIPGSLLQELLMMLGAAITGIGGFIILR